jgi:hypothetical protein
MAAKESSMTKNCTLGRADLCVLVSTKGGRTQDNQRL